jgi:hypothetical protein
MERKIAFLPGEILEICYGDVLQNNNPCSDAWLNSKKSAEVVFPEWLQTFWEGPNNRRL